MKRLLSISLFVLACMACQKTTLQSDSELGLATPDAVEGYVVGIGFLSGSHPNGDATVSYLGATPTSLVVVPYSASNKTVTVTAQPASGYMIDYWWQYKSQPPYIVGTIDRVKVHAKEATFQHNVSAETWFEPVFKLRQQANVVLQTNGGGTVATIPTAVYVDEYFFLEAQADGGYEFDYWTKNGVRYSTSSSLREIITDLNTVTYKANFKPVQTSSGITVALVNQVGEFDYDNRTTIEYCDPTGNWVNEQIGNTAITNHFVLKAGTEMRILVHIESLRGENTYCMWKGPDGTIRDLSNGPNIVEQFTFSGEQLFEGATIVLRAQPDDFREDFYYEWGGNR